MANCVINKITMSGSESDIKNIIELLKNKNPELSQVIDFNNVIKMPESMNIVCGGFAHWYISVYLDTLSHKERADIAQKLKNTKNIYGKNYYQKYFDAFFEDVPGDILEMMQDEYKGVYKSINPSSIEDVGKVYIDNILTYGADTWFDWSRGNWGTKGIIDGSYIMNDSFGFYTANFAALPITEKLSEMFPRVIFLHKWADAEIGQNCGSVELKAGYLVDESLYHGDEAIIFACNMWNRDPAEFDVVVEESKIDSVDEVIQDATVKCSKQPSDGDYEELLEV